MAQIFRNMAWSGWGMGSMRLLVWLKNRHRKMQPLTWPHIGRYLLTADVFDILRDQRPGHGGEVQLVDAINTMAAGGAVCQVPLTGRRFDCGSLHGYLEAIKYVADHELYHGGLE